MLTIPCTGTPYKIGHTHGTLAASQIRSSITFYTSFFQETASLSYPSASALAAEFLPFLTQTHPDLLEEMRGVADGAGVPFEHILALNVRTEISYGMATTQGLIGKGEGKGTTDGCTAVSWHDQRTGLLGQNWDWREGQRGNLVRLRIRRGGGASPRHDVDGTNGIDTTNGAGTKAEKTQKADIDTVTEAGIIGKIGLNSAGIGVCLNAIRAPGVAYDRLPVHLALRVALDRAGTVGDVVAMLEQQGVASSAHILVAGPEGAVGLETSSEDVVRVNEGRVGGARVVEHTNHYVERHEVSDGGGFLEDSSARLERIAELVGEKREVGVEDMKGWLRDEKGLPTSICRQKTGDDSTMTLFSIVMDLKGKKGYVKMGRPTEGGEEVELNACE
ncbi:MAG: hypothetical protein MMC23_000685 [Stictis urceolatum]|nr:hypothetical protein [Stictis urceolata]